MSSFPQIRFLLSVASAAQFPPDTGLEIAMAGRSNAGKSTALNAIIARQGLARTSKTPGRTQLLNYFEIDAEHRLVDLPGYGFARVTPQQRQVWIPLLEALRERRSFGALMLLVDARRGVQAQDIEVLDWAGLVAARAHVLLSKSDQLKSAEARQVLSEGQEALAGRASVQLFSARSKAGVEEARDVLLSWCRK